MKKLDADGHVRPQSEYRKHCRQPTCGCNVCGVHVCKTCWPLYDHNLDPDREKRRKRGPILQYDQ